MVNNRAAFLPTSRLHFSIFLRVASGQGGSQTDRRHDEKAFSTSARQHNQLSLTRARVVKNKAKNTEDV